MFIRYYIELSLTWEPVGLEGVLPRLDANLELGSLGGDRTQLAISARYRPPLGVVGRHPGYRSRRRRRGKCALKQRPLLA
jgi:hypothetical protein